MRRGSFLTTSSITWVRKVTWGTPAPCPSDQIMEKKIIESARALRVPECAHRTLALTSTASLASLSSSTALFLVSSILAFLGPSLKAFPLVECHTRWQEQHH